MLSACIRRSTQSPLWFAATRYRLPLVRLLLESGADVDDGGPVGLTPVAAAATYGCDEAVRFLVAEGANTHTARVGLARGLFNQSKPTNAWQAAFRAESFAELLVGCIEARKELP